MDHFQVEVGKVDEPSGLSTVECLGGVEVGEALVVCTDLYRKWGAMKVMLPGFQSADDGEEFSVIDVIVPFSWGE